MKSLRIQGNFQENLKWKVKSVNSLVLIVKFNSRNRQPGMEKLF